MAPMSILLLSLYIHVLRLQSESIVLSIITKVGCFNKFHYRDEPFALPNTFPGHTTIPTLWLFRSENLAGSYVCASLPTTLPLGQKV